MKSSIIKTTLIATGVIVLAALIWNGCQSSKKTVMGGGDAAQKIYVAPGQKDEFYEFLSGGFSGQMDVYGLPSCRLLKVIPVFSVNAENGYGFNEETKPMLMTSHGFIPWDDSHHPELSMANGSPDGRWLFINSNNTPRIARLDLTTFRTAEIIEIPNTGGNHASPFTTENSEYVVGATRFSVPMGDNVDVPIASYKENFKGTLSFVKIDPQTGHMNINFQILMPGFDYDLAHAGKIKSHDWVFFTCYNSEEANTLLEVNASHNDKDFIAAVNWKKAEEYLAQGKAKDWNCNYAHNLWDDKKQMATTEFIKAVKMLDPKDCPGMVYLIPCAKSPHGCDVDPTGEYIVGGGKLAAVITVYSYTKIQDAIKNNAFDGDFDGIPIIKYEAAMAGEVQKPGLGALHTEFDGKGYGYTSFFVSSEVVKWKIGTWEVVDRIPTYYSLGHLSIPGGDSKTPWAKYLVAMNKITKDRYLPTGPELNQSAQLIDISGDKMKMLYDFPTIGEPHYAQGLPADLITKNQVRIFNLKDNQHPYRCIQDKDTRVERKGNEVHVYMTCTRSHFTPDNIEGIKLGDVVYFHVTNIEQDWDTPHGFAIRGSQNAELLIMPGETCTLKWEAKEIGIIPFYCTDFCSALHQEMQGYLRVSPANSNVPLKWGTGDTAPAI
ncbi:MAG TPA: Sec-dependent nitrous-oxide reductase [Chitinophagales bacterium]|nr:Sec-dependent nitrous-oxide reductase [Chitinophagales bacterium]